MSENMVWLVTLSDDKHTAPLAWGVFDNPFLMTGALAETGITSDAHETAMRNPDGSMACLLIQDSHITATISRCVESFANTIANNEDGLWTVPDSIDGIAEFDGITGHDDTESE